MGLHFISFHRQHSCIMRASHISIFRKSHLNILIHRIDTFSSLGNETIGNYPEEELLASEYIASFRAIFADFLFPSGVAHSYMAEEILALVLFVPACYSIGGINKRHERDSLTGFISNICLYLHCKLIEIRGTSLLRVVEKMLV